MRHECDMVYNFSMSNGPEITYDCDENGYPLDPAHPWNLSPVAWHNGRVDTFVARKLRQLRAVWNASYHASVAAEAWRVCRRFGIAEPTWLQEARATFQNHDGPLKTKRGRLAGEATTERKAMVHYSRWDAVAELRERREELAISGSIYSAAATMLRRHGDHKATADTVKKSVQLVEDKMRADKAVSAHLR